MLDAVPVASDSESEDSSDGRIQLCPADEVDQDLAFMKEMCPEFEDVVQFREGCRKLGPIGVVAFVAVALHV